MALDVLLAVIAAHLRGLLRGRSEPVEDLALPVYVPVTLRQMQHREQAHGNLVGQMVVLLPMGEPDSGLLLEQIAAQAAQAESQQPPQPGDDVPQPASPAAHAATSPGEPARRRGLLDLR